jgi:hypothetical protein
VNRDDDLAEPADMIRFLAPYGRDIAVVDIHDFANVFAMELTADELRRAVTQTYSYLTTPSLCGRQVQQNGQRLVGRSDLKHTHTLPK